MGQPNIIKQLDVYVHVEVFGCPQRICVCQDFRYFTSLPLFHKVFLNRVGVTSRCPVQQIADV